MKRMIEKGYQLCGTVDDIKRAMEPLVRCHADDGELDWLSWNFFCQGTTPWEVQERAARALRHQGDAGVRVGLRQGRGGGELMATALEPEVLVEGMVFPEGPRYRDGSVYVSDMYGGEIWKVGLDGSHQTIAKVEARPSGLGWLPDGTLLSVSMKDRRLLRVAGGGIEPHADLSGLTRYELNDMVVDPAGTAYVGEMGFDLVAGEEPAPGRLLRVSADGEPSEAAAGLMFPNGIALSEDGRTMIVAESLGRQLTAFDVGADGTLSNQRVWAPLDVDFLDGICLDADGGVWVGTLFGQAFVRILEGGEITHRVETPGRWAVACTLGGENRGTLFMATAETTQEDLEELRSEGRVETAEAPFPGTGLP